MDLPDYSKYSIEELYEALNSINLNNYPERVEEIRKEIENRKGKKNRFIQNKSNKKFPSFNFLRYIAHFRKTAILLQIISLLFGLSLFINFIFNLRLSAFAYKIGLSFPGFLDLKVNSRLFIFNILVISMNTSFIIGSIGSFLNKELFKILLAVAWGFMAFGFELWLFRWWPTPIYDIPISIVFDFFGIAIGFKVNIISVFFFSWASILVNKFRNDILS